MSIKQNSDLPNTGGSVQDLTSIFKITLKDEGDGHTSSADLTSVQPVRQAARPSRAASPEPQAKKVDGFLIFLYVLLAAGIAGVAWVTFWLFTPSPAVLP